MIAELVEQTQFNESARVVCPFCSPERRKSNIKDMTLSRKDDGAVVYHCHHCFENGSVQPRKEHKLSAVPSTTVINKPLAQPHYDWLNSRGISPSTADKMKLFAADKFFHKIGRVTPAIGFPYFRRGSLVATKYRSIDSKDFTQDMGGAHDFFGIDNIEAGKPIIIVEGEMDALSAIEAGLNNVVSVPSGAPMKVAEASRQDDKRFAFINNAQEILDKAPYVILATDQDTSGQALAEELARRIGKDKCRLAKFNKKDLNEVLLDDDPTLDDVPSTVIKRIIDSAEPYPVAGLCTAAQFEDRLNTLYSKGTGKGVSTGYDSVDNIYTVAPSQLTVVTGYPSSGKSNFVDQLMVNISRNSDWKFAICSFENQPEVHISRLMEIYSKKRFFDGKERMTEAERDEAFKWVSEHFVFIETNGDEPSSLDSILSRAATAVKSFGAKGLVIDPYNYIDMNKTSTTETEAISSMLSRVVKFCKTHDVHTWFVAHPSKINRSGVDQPRPDGMAISGSMAWWAKTDCGITVHRGDGCVEIAVWKCRYRWVGQQGETSLLYNKVSGTYEEHLDHF
jgi:twinkle protein